VALGGTEAVKDRMLWSRKRNCIKLKHGVPQVGLDDRSENFADTHLFEMIDDIIVDR
jgi:hypothetical protein